MIIKSPKELSSIKADSTTTLPVLPLKTTIIFPGEINTIQIGRTENLALLEAVEKNDGRLVLSYAPQGSISESSLRLSQVGVIAKIQYTKPAMADSKMVTIEGLRRAVLTEIKKTSPYLLAETAELADDPAENGNHTDIIAEVMGLVATLVRFDHRYAPEIIYTLEMNRSVPGCFADRIGAIIHFPLAARQEILEAITVTERLNLLARLLQDEVDKVSLSVHINNRVEESLERKKREKYLRQQLMEIRRELGEEFVEEDLSRAYLNRIKENKSVPLDVANRLVLEAERLRHLSSSSAEYGTTKNYIDLMLELPWGQTPPKGADLVKVEESINAEYYGLSNVKEQVLEYLALRQMSQESHDLPILCLAGAVGTGKASLVRAIASAIGRPFVRINGASMIAVEDIKGSHRGDIGSGPGQLVRALQRAGTFDLVLYLEDLEYVIESEDTNALLALLEAVDPRQNGHFVDSFVGIPIDISRILFVLGVSSSENFPEPFVHRLEMVEMPGYIEREKIVIAKRHILPKLYKRHGLSRAELRFSDKALARIIRNYTMEAGLISLQQQMEKIFRRVTRRKATTGECCYLLSDINVDQFLGTPQYIPEKAMATPEIGVANGLAWTGAGGDLMLIEGLKMRGTGQVIYTGSLGDVMKESIQAAHSFVRSRADMLGIDHNDFVNFDIHIHFPMGAIPKDGPSAGVTVSLVVASVMAERPIRNDIAMTGEVTLRGRVLPVSGIKEKVSAAYRAGLRTVILPKENEKGIKDIPREIVRQTTFIFIETVDELFEKALLDFTPSTYTLEKIFAEEIEKARKRTHTKSKKKPSLAAQGKRKGKRKAG